MNKYKALFLLIATFLLSANMWPPADDDAAVSVGQREVPPTPTATMCPTSAPISPTPQISSYPSFLGDYAIPLIAPPPPKWECKGFQGDTKPADGKYFLAVFGCWIDEYGSFHSDSADNCQPGCITELRRANLCVGDGPECEATIQYYTAGNFRYPCLSKLRITNPQTGKSVVAMVIDSGPACWVEIRANGPIMDTSWPVSLYLFGVGHGWIDKVQVLVEEVGSDMPLGPTVDGVTYQDDNLDVGYALWAIGPSVPRAINVRGSSSASGTIVRVLYKTDDTHPVLRLAAISKDGQWGRLADDLGGGWVWLVNLVRIN